ncbi:MAG: hypothetical protein IJ071_09040 [Ruminococcus sp.]|nr:hypothetical protein [Ruminococcus sp.]
MKKFISAALAASLTAASAAVLPAKAEEGSDMSIVVLGDSIASGYGLESGEYCYGEILSDYYDSAYYNAAVPGATSEDLAKQLEEPSEELSGVVAGADIVVISIGGNDLINYGSRFLLEFAASNNFMTAGYTADDIPTRPTFGDLENLLDRSAAAEYINDAKNTLTMAKTTARLTANLRMTQSTKYDCIIETQVIPNIDRAVTAIRGLNSDPDLKIVVQTIYDPLQFENGFLDEHMTANRKTVINAVSPIFQDVLGVDPSSTTAKCFKTQISEYAAEKGLIVADVYTDFTSAEAGKSEKYSWFFTDIQEEGDELDFHPNKKGHLAIAATIANAVGDMQNDGGLMRKTFRTLADKDSYPAVALAAYKSAVGIFIGDVNMDGSIDSTDASEILADYALVQTGAPSALDEDQRIAGNIDGDTAVDATDASTVLSYYAYTQTGGTGSLRDFLKK